MDEWRPNNVGGFQETQRLSSISTATPVDRREVRLRALAELPSLRKWRLKRDAPSIRRVIGRNRAGRAVSGIKRYGYTPDRLLVRSRQIALQRQKRLCRFGDGPVLIENALEVAPLLLALLSQNPDAPARNDEAAQVAQETQEKSIVARGPDGAVKIEVRLDRILPGAPCPLEMLERALDLAQLPRAAPLRRETGGLDLDRDPQLHQLQHVTDAAYPGRIDLEPPLRFFATKTPAP